MALPDIFWLIFCTGTSLATLGLPVHSIFIKWSLGNRKEIPEITKDIRDEKETIKSIEEGIRTEEESDGDSSEIENLKDYLIQSRKQLSTLTRYRRKCWKRTKRYEKVASIGLILVIFGFVLEMSAILYIFLIQ